MELIPTALAAVVRVVPPRFGDDRGFFAETFRSEWFPDIDFCQDNHSLSAKAGTVRGLHFQIPPAAQDKLVRVSRGSILDVAVDIRVGSPTYGEHVVVPLGADNWEQLLVPKGFAHGFVTLEPDTEVLYKVSAYYSAEHDRGILWNDADLDVDWGVAPEAATVSEKDAANPPFADLPEYFTHETP
jgi:dTDP-4-dehydrorhamnose 3,5-epimerase